MTREEFKELFGEYPEDVLGNDFEQIIDELLCQE